MRKVVQYLLWVFVFTMPWDTIVLPGVGALSRVLGLVTFAAAVLTTAVEGRFRRPGPIFGLAVAFVAFGDLSLLWTVSPAATTTRVWTDTQLLGVVWMVQEFARTREERQSLLVAFCLGAFIPLADLLNNFRLGININRFSPRFSTTGGLRINADGLGLILVLGIPMAWHLVLQRGGIVRIVALIYFALAPIGVLLTGARGAFLAGLVALSIVPLTQPPQSLRTLLRSTVLFIFIVATAALVVPQSLWDRIFTIQSEIMGGTMTGRTEIWKAGLTVFPDHPLLGVGTGAYGPAVQHLLGKAHAPHNMLLAVLVEQGIVGFCLFAALLGVCVLTIWRMPSPDWKLWAALMLSWLVGVLSLNMEGSKVMWLLFGLLAAQPAVQAVGQRISRPIASGRDSLTPTAHLGGTPPRRAVQFQ